MRPLVELLTRSRAFHTFAAAAPGCRAGDRGGGLELCRRPARGPAAGLGLPGRRLPGHRPASPCSDGRQRRGDRWERAHPRPGGADPGGRDPSRRDRRRHRGPPRGARRLGGGRGRRRPARAGHAGRRRRAERRPRPAQLLEDEPALAAVATADGPDVATASAAAPSLRHLAEQRSDDEYRRRLADGTAYKFHGRRAGAGASTCLPWRTSPRPWRLPSPERPPA